jgi:SNF2 family DNA or RNA helicase
MSEKIIESGWKKLKQQQKEIVEECIAKKSGGISLMMGGGKTLIGITLALKLQVNTVSIIVVSKSLIGTWVSEIKKFYDGIDYIVFHSEYIKKSETYEMKENIKIIITTPEMITKYYKKHNIEDVFVNRRMVNEGQFNQHIIKEYSEVKSVMLKSIGDKTLQSQLFRQEWGSIIIDEGHNHTEIESTKCKAISALYSKNKWLMSGTLFNEPKVSRILGYHIMINDKTFPRNLGEAEKFVKSSQFKGINKTLVTREKQQVKNINGETIKINKKIIKDELTKEEEMIYGSLKNILGIIKTHMERYKNQKDTDNMRKYTAYLLAMVTYLRQVVVCPMLVFANCALDASDYKNKSELSNMIFNGIQNLGIKNYMENEESVKSSRIKAVLREIKQVKERIVVFTSFRTSVDILKHYISKERDVFSIDANMSIKKRGQIIEKFKSSNGVLVMTYNIGCEGLNLQESKTAMLVDLDWNDGKTKQAIARVLRSGQKSEEVNVYIFTSNTGMEKAIYEKHEMKLNILEEIKEGPMKSKVKSMSTKEILKILNIEECSQKLKDLGER